MNSMKNVSFKSQQARLIYVMCHYAGLLAVVLLPSSFFIFLKYKSILDIIVLMIGIFGFFWIAFCSKRNEILEIKYNENPERQKAEREILSTSLIILYGFYFLILSITSATFLKNIL